MNENVSGSPLFVVQSDDDGGGGDAVEEKNIPLLVSKANDSPRQQQQKQHQHRRVVVWTQESEDWDVGEVWVSPDLTELFQAVNLYSSLSEWTEVVVMLEGQSEKTEKSRGRRLSWLDVDRAVYGVHDELGTCLSPTLVIEIQSLTF